MMKRCVTIGEPKPGETPILVSPDHERMLKELPLLDARGMSTILACFE